MADQTPEQRRYNTPAGQPVPEGADDLAKTAQKMPTDKSEQKVTRGTEGSVETTTHRPPERTNNG